MLDSGCPRRNPGGPLEAKAGCLHVSGQNQMTTETRETDQAYRERADRYAAASAGCAARSRAISHGRLVCFLAAGAAFIWLLDPGGPVPLQLTLAVVLTLGFFGLVLYQNRVNFRCRWYGDLSALNEEGLARRARDWGALPYDDSIIGDPDHPFADDLDLFGRASLFSLLGTVATAPGAATLREWLLEPADTTTIAQRQSAVAELSPLIDLRQEATTRGRMIHGATPASLERFLGWAESDPWLPARRWVIWTARTLVVVTFTLVALNIMGIVSYLAWLAALAVNLAFSYTVGKQVHHIFDRAFARESKYQRYAEIFKLVTTASLTAPRLQQLQTEMAGGGIPAYRQLERLHRILSLAEVRFSMPYVAIQAFTLWDFHVLARLESWQVTAGRQARGWLRALGEFDALAALAGLRFDNPGWAFAEVGPFDPAGLSATDLGHPLLNDEARVVNDVKLGPPGTFLLITGSNMSGKSTLLRAIGANVALARAGGPVCAAAMRLPPLALETSMRVHDSLQAGLSHFMAELERLKRVVSAARRAPGPGTLLYLLDDIFQGTNTVERRTAARKVVAHLLQAGAIGAVTSHDLALAETDELSAACDAVHFTECVEETADGPRITFDYKLRPGIATSKNALKLLEIVGLDSSDAETEGGAAP
jgi:ABC-type multidrug transport system fused ATPase/permease subunit